MKQIEADLHKQKTHTHNYTYCIRSKQKHKQSAMRKKKKHIVVNKKIENFVHFEPIINRRARA